jgi:hypothetical protein
MYILCPSHNGDSCKYHQRRYDRDPIPCLQLATDMAQNTCRMITDALRPTWYMAIHDLLRTNERLYRIALTDTNPWDRCGQIDTLTHRITGCGVGKDMWNWTRARLAPYRRTPYSGRLASSPLFLHMVPAATRGNFVDPGTFHLLSYTTPQPARPTELC